MFEYSKEYSFCVLNWYFCIHDSYVRTYIMIIGKYINLCLLCTYVYLIFAIIPYATFVGFNMGLK